MEDKQIDKMIDFISKYDNEYDMNIDLLSMYKSVQAEVTKEQNNE